MFFISRFCDLGLFRGDLYSRCIIFSYVNSINTKTFGKNVEFASDQIRDISENKVLELTVMRS